MAQQDHPQQLIQIGEMPPQCGAADQQRFGQVLELQGVTAELGHHHPAGADDLLMTLTLARSAAQIGAGDVKDAGAQDAERCFHAAPNNIINSVCQYK